MNRSKHISTLKKTENSWSRLVHYYMLALVVTFPFFCTACWHTLQELWELERFLNDRRLQCKTLFFSYKLKMTDIKLNCYCRLLSFVSWKCVKPLDTNLCWQRSYLNFQADLNRGSRLLRWATSICSYFCSCHDFSPPISSILYDTKRVTSGFFVCFFRSACMFFTKLRLCF